MSSHPKLFPEDIERIREQALFGARNSDQARAWGVSPSTTHAARAQPSVMRQAYPNPPMFDQLQRFCLAAVLA